jgi:uncharacterized membrane protein YdjX (TVP38/TMEM64 family)
MKLPSKEKLKKYLKILVVLLVVAAISVGIYFVLRHFGFTDADKLKGWIKSTGGWAVIVYILLRVSFTIFLSFVPACSMIFDLLSVATFDYYPPIVIFLICFTSVVITSVIMDLIGRFGGNKAIIKILGKEDYEEAKDLIQEKGMVYVPVMYLLPIFPDDAICMVSGATKMNFWVHLAEIVLCRGIGCATIVFGLQIIPQDLVNNLKEFNWVFIRNNIIEYIRLLVVIVAYLGLLFWFTRKIDKWLTKYLKKRKTNKELKQAAR